ncbi:hypothetical protein IE81DRAFT_367611 [Ceraceosorus guamensis]|uniref:Uncharacterized protein n=1 Tax=Ceraceosorus guamensis TaxID=1522189 RepID=A0A316VUY8_9BASI|nr:hypothetical protein IE81DRAFT_367611 [Ceraceosorus guamensis]PWN41242.1 hypothetical protein IE81DRAFT_367611 [Ceraceosorus guamensis]
MAKSLAPGVNRPALGENRGNTRGFLSAEHLQAVARSNVGENSARSPPTRALAMPTDGAAYALSGSPSPTARPPPPPRQTPKTGGMQPKSPAATLTKGAEQKSKPKHNSIASRPLSVSQTGATHVTPRPDPTVKPLSTPHSLAASPRKGVGVSPTRSPSSSALTSCEQIASQAQAGHVANTSSMSPSGPASTTLHHQSPGQSQLDHHSETSQPNLATSALSDASMQQKLAPLTSYQTTANQQAEIKHEPASGLQWQQQQSEALGQSPQGAASAVDSSAASIGVLAPLDGPGTLCSDLSPQHAVLRSAAASPAQGSREQNTAASLSPPPHVASFYTSLDRTPDVSGVTTSCKIEEHHQEEQEQDAGLQQGPESYVAEQWSEHDRVVLVNHLKAHPTDQALFIRQCTVAEGHPWCMNLAHTAYQTCRSSVIWRAIMPHYDSARAPKREALFTTVLTQVEHLERLVDDVLQNLQVSSRKLSLDQIRQAASSAPTQHMRILLETDAHILEGKESQFPWLSGFRTMQLAGPPQADVSSAHTSSADHLGLANVTMSGAGAHSHRSQSAPLAPQSIKHEDSHLPQERYSARAQCPGLPPSDAERLRSIEGSSSGVARDNTNATHPALPWVLPSQYSISNAAAASHLLPPRTAIPQTNHHPAPVPHHADELEQARESLRKEMTMAFQAQTDAMKRKLREEISAELQEEHAKKYQRIEHQPQPREQASPDVEALPFQITSHQQDEMQGVSNRYQSQSAESEQLRRADDIAWEEAIKERNDAHALKFSTLEQSLQEKDKTIEFLQEEHSRSREYFTKKIVGLELHKDKVERELKELKGRLARGASTKPFDCSNFDRKGSPDARPSLGL